MEDDTCTLIDVLLEEQRDLTAVERFARWDRAQFAATSYRRLLPLNAPRPGEQYAFEVDLDRCSGCKACVTACHSLNGLDETETWRNVGLLISPSSSPNSQPTQQHVTTACHHCVDPACLNGCPALAYEKDSLTGIVHHLADRCIGCEYCVMKCPYQVPRYSHRLGIVRKCDLCSERLAAEQAPACVQACPNEAIRITLVSQAEITAQFRGVRPSSGAETGERAGQRIPSAFDGAQLAATEDSRTPLNAYSFAGGEGRRSSGNGHAGRVAACGANSFLPDSPDPRLTLPTTRYVSKQPCSPLVAADEAALRLAPPHGALVLMLVLTQAAAGIFLMAALLAVIKMSDRPKELEIGGAGLLCAGLFAAVFHLGRPWKAWRAFLGWRKSWLSREVIAFHGFALAALLTLPALRLAALEKSELLLAAVAAVLGLVSVFASAMVYVDTRKPAWAWRITFGNFFGATLLLGATLAAASLGWSARLFGSELGTAARLAAAAALLIRTVLFLWRRSEFRAALRNPRSPVHLNARSIRELLAWTAPAGNTLFVASTVFGILALGHAATAPWWGSLAALTTFSSELIARYVFFAGSAGRGMPGGIAA